MWRVWYRVFQMYPDGTLGRQLTGWTIWEIADDKRLEEKAEKRGVWMQRTALPHDREWWDRWERC